MTVTARALRETLTARKRVERQRDEERREHAVSVLRMRCAELVARGTVAEAWLVGSAAWGGFGVRSDVDVVVRGLEPTACIDVADGLCAAAGVEVDLLRLEDLPERFRARVLAEGERLA
jgi:predicted nucleotidyltransferase